MTNAEIIWNYFKGKNFTNYAIAGIMGNLRAESRLLPNNLQDSYNRSLGMTDEEYTERVDTGRYTNFIYDSAGYGLAQWTYWSLKKELYDLCQERNKSIADMDCQLDCLYQQIKSHKLVDSLNAVGSVRAASDIFLTKFERPLNQGESVQVARANYGLEFYNQFASGKTIVKGGTQMKYSDANKPLVCMMTNSTCYKGTSTMQVKGVLWHSTGANNPWLKRYVQPSDNASDRAEMLAKLGQNQYRNDWNHASISAGLNCWIGKLADGTVTTVQTMPWNYKPWGCGSGSRGSCNNGWIQFEICEDGLTDSNYFNQIYKEACEITAYLCKMYNLNPKGSVSMGGVSVPVILCHQDSYKLGLGSNHSDVYHWFNRYGKTMDNVRNDVAQLMGDTSAIVSQPTSSQPFTSSSILRKGSQGSAVVELQNNLMKLGYKLPKWGADGDFGQETLDAVIQFQSDKGLDPDGEVGPLTQTAIKQALLSTSSSTPSSTTSTSTSSAQIYRIRKSWSNASSQIGAYRVLENAIVACKQAGKEYKVFDMLGKVMYENKEEITTLPPTTTTSAPIIEQPKEETVKPATSYSNVVLGSSSKDENGEYRGGQAGDQTGKEVWILNWYDGGWNYVIRPKTNALAEKIASACEKGCNNANIGYDQNQRNTLLAEAKKVGMDLSKITSPCECDCASFVSTCCVCAGLPEGTFFSGGNGRTTYNLLSACESTGQFTVLSSTNYTKSKDYLKRGDILLASGHTVIVLWNGSKAESSTATPSAPSTNSSFLVKVTADKLNVRSGPSMDNNIVLQIKKGEVYTIIEEKEGWGKLKSGAGWINLSYTQRM